MTLRITPRFQRIPITGIAVKSHGSTDDFGFANAIGVAIDLRVNGFLQKISVELARLNVRQIYGGGFRCYADRERFFSYRRDTKTGRMGSMVWLTQ